MVSIGNTGPKVTINVARGSWLLYRLWGVEGVSTIGWSQFLNECQAGEDGMMK